MGRKESKEQPTVSRTKSVKNLNYLRITEARCVSINTRRIAFSTEHRRIDMPIGRCPNTVKVGDCVVLVDEGRGWEVGAPMK